VGLACKRKETEIGSSRAVNFSVKRRARQSLGCGRPRSRNVIGAEEEASTNARRLAKGNGGSQRDGSGHPFENIRSATPPFKPHTPSYVASHTNLVCRYTVTFLQMRICQEQRPQARSIWKILARLLEASLSTRLTSHTLSGNSVCTL